MRTILCALLVFAGLATSQDRKHFMTTPLSGERQVRMEANSISRLGQYPGAIHLRGEVEIKAPVCLPLGSQNRLTCDGYLIVRSDDATFHEGSGQIDANGSVTIIPLYHEPKSPAR